MFSVRGEVAIPIGSGDAAIYEEIAPGNECAIRPHEQCANRCHFVWSANSSSRGNLEHPPIPFATWTSQFISGKRSHDNAGADCVYPSTPFPPAHCFGHHTQGISAFRELVRVKGILHLLRMQERQTQ